MDFQYSCGHSRQGGTGATIHEICPACGKGALIGVRGKVTVNRDDLQAMVDAMQEVKPLTRKEQPIQEGKPTIRLNDWKDKEFQKRVECPDHGLTIGQTFCSGCRQREELIKRAAEIITEGYEIYVGAEEAAGRLYDAGVLRKAGDQ